MLAHIALLGNAVGGICWLLFSGRLGIGEGSRETLCSKEGERDTETGNVLNEFELTQEGKKEKLVTLV